MESSNQQLHYLHDWLVYSIIVVLRNYGVIVAPQTFTDESGRAKSQTVNPLVCGTNLLLLHFQKFLQ